MNIELLSADDYTIAGFNVRNMQIPQSTIIIETKIHLALTKRPHANL
jgi:hypothetical protein